jgi:uncharacterized protein
MSSETPQLMALLAEYSMLPEFEGIGLTSVQDRGRWNSMPLHIAIHRKRSNEVKILLDGGADPNAPGEYGERPLHVAVRRGLFEIIEMLMRAGARCDLQDKDGLDVWNQAEATGVTQRLQQVERSIREKGQAGRFQN